MKKKVRLHRGVDIVSDVIVTRLKNVFKLDRSLRRVTRTPSGVIIFYIIKNRTKWLFLFSQNTLSCVGPVPENVEWSSLAELAEKGHLCPEALLCLAQGIEFDPSAKLL